MCLTNLANQCYFCIYIWCLVPSGPCPLSLPFSQTSGPARLQQALGGLAVGLEWCCAHPHWCGRDVLLAAGSGGHCVSLCSLLCHLKFPAQVMHWFLPALHLIPVAPGYLLVASLKVLTRHHFPRLSQSHFASQHFLWWWCCYFL